ncbi:Hypothetical protein D9617_10g072780 [Elsinoe fawcettii]|nr:Hypothetical protein D9617_10g072780 [Elsinoe fawcettii]
MAFEESARGIEVCYIDDTLPEAAIALLRYAYTLDYLPPGSQAANFPLPIHLELYRLGRNFDAEPLKDQAYMSIVESLEQACYGRQRPIQFIDALRFAYDHYPDDQKLLSSLLSYCATNLIQHDFLFDSAFVALLNEQPIFHQDLCVASMSHGLRNEGAQTFIQVGAHCRTAEPTSFMSDLKSDHPLHPDRATCILSKMSPARRQLILSLLSTPEAKASKEGKKPKAAAFEDALQVEDDPVLPHNRRNPENAELREQISTVLFPNAKFFNRPATVSNTHVRQQDNDVDQENLTDYERFLRESTQKWQKFANDHEESDNRNIFPDPHPGSQGPARGIHPGFNDDTPSSRHAWRFPAVPQDDPSDNGTSPMPIPEKSPPAYAGSGFLKQNFKFGGSESFSAQRQMPFRSAQPNYGNPAPSFHGFGESSQAKLISPSPFSPSASSHQPAHQSKASKGSFGTPRKAYEQFLDIHKSGGEIHGPFSQASPVRSPAVESLIRLIHETHQQQSEQADQPGTDNDLTVAQGKRPAVVGTAVQDQAEEAEGPATPSIQMATKRKASSSSPNSWDEVDLGSTSSAKRRSVGPYTPEESDTDLVHVGAEGSNESQDEMDDDFLLL